MKSNPRFFFSFRSPFSWLAIERLQRIIPNVLDQIEFIPYWEPDGQTKQALEQRDATFHYVQMSKAKHLYILQDTKRLAEGLGLKIAWPVDSAPWWEPAHLGWLKARRLGKAAPFYSAVTQSRWLRGENISDPKVIESVAASVGLDPGAIAGAVDDPDIREEGVNSLAEAYHDDIFGVPYMRYGRHRFWGFDRLDGFIKLLLSSSGACDIEDDGKLVAARADVPMALQHDIGAYDTDSAGGCG